MLETVTTDRIISIVYMLETLITDRIIRILYMQGKKYKDIYLEMYQTTVFFLHVVNTEIARRYFR